MRSTNDVKADMVDYLSGIYESILIDRNSDYYDEDGNEEEYEPDEFPMSTSEIESRLSDFDEMQNSGEYSDFTPDRRELESYADFNGLDVYNLAEKLDVFDEIYGDADDNEEDEEFEFYEDEEYPDEEDYY